MNHETKLTAVAGGMMPPAPSKIGMLMRVKNFTRGYFLWSSQKGTGAKMPNRKNQFIAEYWPSVPKIRFGPTRPQMTDASKNTRSEGHVHGLFAARRVVSHMLGTVDSSHQAVPMFTVEAMIVPMI